MTAVLAAGDATAAAAEAATTAAVSAAGRRLLPAAAGPGGGFDGTGSGCDVNAGALLAARDRRSPAAVLVCSPLASLTD